MPGRTSSYTKTKDAEVKIRIIDILNNATDGDMPTTDWIKQQDITLTGYTTQKIARILGTLVEMGLVVKSKSRSTNRMVYRLRAKMEDAGYSFAEPKITSRAWNGVSWEAEDEGDEEIDFTEYD